MISCLLNLHPDINFYNNIEVVDIVYTCENFNKIYNYN